MICGSCGMRMDGGAVLACKVRMYDIAQAGHVPVISAMGNLPIVKDLVVDMDPFWQKMRAVEPYLQPRLRPGRRSGENIVSQERMDVIHKESLCINCGCCVSECNSMESDPDFLGPPALAKGMRFVGDPRDGGHDRAARAVLERARDLGLHALLLLQRALPEGRRPARRDREARRRGDEGRDRPRHGREAREVVRHLGEDDRLAARDRARAEDAGHRLVDQGDEVRDGLAVKGKVPPPFPPHVAEDVEESRALYDLVKTQGRDGAAGIVQGEKALARIEHTGADAGEPRSVRRSRSATVPVPAGPSDDETEGGRRREEGRVLQGLPRLALGEGARHLDAGARAEGRATSCSSSSRSPAAAPATSTRRSPTTTCT